MEQWNKPEVRVKGFRSWDKAGFVDIKPDAFRALLEQNPDDRFLVRMEGWYINSKENHTRTTHRGWWTGSHLLHDEDFPMAYVVSYKRMNLNA